jgi:hypothetical protein
MTAKDKLSFIKILFYEIKMVIDTFINFAEVLDSLWSK